MSAAARLVVLISGGGSNLQAILDACADGRLPAQVVMVISNRADAYGLQRAAAAGIPALALPRRSGQDRHAYDGDLAQCVSACRPDWVVLAGWMRILTPAFLSAFPGRVINLHPALPGTFPGTHAIQRAYEAFQRGEITRTGVMVHLVPDEGVDCGPVLNSAEIPIDPADTLATLEARMHSVEHRLLVETIAGLLARSAPLPPAGPPPAPADLR